MKTIEPQDAPLGIVAMKPEGPWHILSATADVFPGGDTYTGREARWTFWGDTLCATQGAAYRDWRYLRIPADLPDGARLCKRCEKALAAREGEADA